MTGHRARKRFGQNFLVDRGVIERIVAAVAPRPGDALVEIGPGLGALTRPLLERAGRLHVVEIDRDLAERLRLRGLDGLVVHEADVLEWIRAPHLGEPHLDLPPLRLVGNLPYNIGTPLLLRLVPIAATLVDVHVMLQKEVVDRLEAKVGTKAWGRLGVMMRAAFRIERLFDVASGAFDPAPKVRSAVVRLLPRADVPDATRLASLERAARLAFANRRKTLRNNFRGVLEPDALEALGISPTVRAETLSLEDFLRLGDALGPG